MHNVNKPTPYAHTRACFNETHHRNEHADWWITGGITSVCIWVECAPANRFWDLAGAESPVEYSHLSTTNSTLLSPCYHHSQPGSINDSAQSGGVDE